MARAFGGSFEQISPYSTQQQGALNQLLQMAMGQMGGGGGMGQMGIGMKPFDFAPIAQQARTQFQQQTIPSIAERFTSMGGQRSSGFQEALGGAGAGLEEALASQGAQFGMQQQGQQMNQLMQLLGLALRPQYETAYRQPEQQQQSTFMQMLPGLLAGGGALAGGLLGGPAGIGLGGTAGSWLGRLFGGGS